MDFCQDWSFVFLIQHFHLEFFFLPLSEHYKNMQKIQNQEVAQVQGKLKQHTRKMVTNLKDRNKTKSNNKEQSNALRDQWFLLQVMNCQLEAAEKEKICV